MANDPLIFTYNAMSKRPFIFVPLFAFSKSRETLHAAELEDPSRAWGPESLMKNHIIALVTLAFAISELGGLGSLAQAAPHGIYPTRQNRELFKMLGITAAAPSAAAADAGKVVYYGGPVIANAKIYTVMWGAAVDATTQKQIGGFYTNVVNSSYMDWLKEYNTTGKAVDGRAGTNQTIGRGSYKGQLSIKPANTATNLDDKDIQAEIAHQIDIGALPKPDDNTLFMTYFPPGFTLTIDGQGSCSAFCAYHEGFKSEKYGNVFYGVMPDLGGACSFGCGPEQSNFDNLTSVSSHEMIEAITDPYPTPGNTPAFPQAWNTSDGNEIGDLCADNNTKLSTQGLTYTVQEEFDNVAGACTPGPFQSP